MRGNCIQLKSSESQIMFLVGEKEKDEREVKVRRKTGGREEEKKKTVASVRI